MNKRENSQVNQQITYDIYVSNVPKNLAETDLKQVFIKYGEIKQVLCRWKEEHGEVGYAIVKFIYKEDADNLLHGTEEVSWNGHPLPIKAARRSDHNQYNGNVMVESKANCFPDVSPKTPILMNPASFLKGGHGFFYHGQATFPNNHPGPAAFQNNHPKRHTEEFLLPDFGFCQSSNYQGDQNAHSVPVNLEVLCTTVEDAVTFYGVILQRLDELSNVTRAMNSLNLTQNRIDKKPLTKKVYAAVFSEDHSWYRCIVTRQSVPNKPGMCTVHYIDYGNHEDTPCRNVVELPDQLQKIPAFASKFIFSNLMCECKSNKQTYLHQLTEKRMTLCAILSPTNSEFQVLKCSCNGKDVISETVKKGFASFKKSHRSGNSKCLASKQSSSKSNSESSEVIKATMCNGTNGHSENILTNSSILDNSNNKKARKSVSRKDSFAKNEDGNNIEVNEDSDFHPKMIIKRGSDLSGIVGSVSTPELKRIELKKPDEQKLKNSSVTMDSVISNLKLINNIRTLLSQSTDDSIIKSAVKILQSEVKSVETFDDFTNTINEAFKSYIKSFNDVKNCKDKNKLPNLKFERNIRKNNLCSKLKEFLDNFDNSIFERKKKILQIIVDLASNTNDWMNVELKTKPSSIDELIFEYNKVKEEKWKLVRNARDKTNEMHAKFMDVYTAIGKAFYLNTLEDNNNKCELLDINNQCKRKPYSVMYEETLKDFGEAIDEEIHTHTLNKGENTVSIIECLLLELDVHKDKVESVCEFYGNKLRMFKELSEAIDPDSLLSKLASIQEEVCSSLLRLSHCKDSNEEDNKNSQNELPCVIRDLHIALLKEDDVIQALSKAVETCYPELCIEHPELKLSEFFQSKFLLKYNWKPEYFLNLEKMPRGNSFISRLLDNPVVIKEYKHETREDMVKFLEICFLWNECRCDFLLKIVALFFKKENTLCVVCPLIQNSLLSSVPIPMPTEGIKACNMLRQVLVSLNELHSRKVIYGGIHPSTILIDNEKVLLDFCFNSKLSDEEMILKGINFCPPGIELSEMSGDMYSFGCLVLWLLFPNFSFTSMEEGVPNLTGFRSIIEEALTTKDYLLLCQLVSIKKKSRPSAALLLSKGFLTNFESYCRSRCKAV